MNLVSKLGPVAYSNFQQSVKCYTLKRNLKHDLTTFDPLHSGIPRIPPSWCYVLSGLEASPHMKPYESPPLKQGPGLRWSTIGDASGGRGLPRTEVRWRHELAEQVRDGEGW